MGYILFFIYAIIFCVILVLELNGMIKQKITITPKSFMIAILVAILFPISAALILIGALMMEGIDIKLDDPLFGGGEEERRHSECSCHGECEGECDHCHCCDDEDNEEEDDFDLDAIINGVDDEGEEIEELIHDLP